MLLKNPYRTYLGFHRRGVLNVDTCLALARQSNRHAIQTWLWQTKFPGCRRFDDSSICTWFSRWYLHLYDLCEEHATTEAIAMPETL